MDRIGETSDRSLTGVVRQLIDIPEMSWVDHAVCADEDPELFFPDHADRKAVEKAKQVCRRCPVVSDCFSYAAKARPRVHGVWGGSFWDDRGTSRRRTGHGGVFPVPARRELSLGRSSAGYGGWARPVQHREHR